jgi:cytochrome c biogenesis protein CcmG, thiol:disulfide interchange protein DsbE
MKKALIPLVLFIVLAVFLAIGLTRDPHEVPSPLINKPAPLFQTARLDAPSQTFSSKDMLGKVWLLNVWASWCVACRIEHPLLMEYAKAKLVPIVGLDYKDKDDEGQRWLGRFGNPYDLIIVDRDGRIGIEFGVYGVPETFLIDKAGVIRYKQIGPITEQSWNDKILPMIRELQK